jgi:hypothetical protein
MHDWHPLTTAAALEPGSRPAFCRLTMPKIGLSRWRSGERLLSRQRLAALRSPPFVLMNARDCSWWPIARDGRRLRCFPAPAGKGKVHRRTLRAQLKN